jgi:hypothetical protein
MDRRNDYKTALLVEAVINPPQPRTPADQARELAGLGVPIEVALRVLTRPSARRHQAWLSAEFRAV